jgi:hypothetical protein
MMHLPTPGIYFFADDIEIYHANKSPDCSSLHLIFTPYKVDALLTIGNSALVK